MLISTKELNKIVKKDKEKVISERILYAALDGEKYISVDWIPSETYKKLIELGYIIEASDREDEVLICW